MRGKRLAIVVSHPIQYYAPLYQRLARRDDIEIKVFFTWHAGASAMRDSGFRQQVAWDVPLTDGYEHELVPNTSSNPGTHSFWGLRNPGLVARVMDWHPDAVHVTGWAGCSHLLALRSFSERGIPILFRGDSHLLDSSRTGPGWWLKEAVLRQVYSWPAKFLYVGSVNRAYYEAFGVSSDRLVYCPHSIDVSRFALPESGLAAQAIEWRRALGIGEDKVVLLFAGKFEPRKRPLELMRAIRKSENLNFVLLMVGAGELESEVSALAAATPDLFRVLPFQNQSRMPVVYRLGDIFVLPSSYGETWGLAVNEALACGRPAIVSDRVGCAADVIDESCGRVFPRDDFSVMIRQAVEMTADRASLAAMGRAASRQACAFDIARTESSLVNCFADVSNP